MKITMNLHLKEIDWRQYLDTPDHSNPAEWIENVYQAFCKEYIDYADIHLAYQRYEPEPMWVETLGEYWKKMVKEERRQDMQRARIYKEQHK